VAHIALLATFLSWVYGGTRVEFLTAVPWLTLAVLEMTLLLPAPRKHETLDTARLRVWRRITRDPLLYIGTVLFLYLLVQCWNGGRKLAYNGTSGTWYYAPAPFGWGPFCLVPAEACQVLYWFPMAFAVVLGIRHGITRRGKLVLLRALSVNGALLSIFGMIQYGSGTMKMFWTRPMSEKFFASFGYNHAGAYFTLLFAISMGLFVHALLADDERKHAIWLGAVMALNLVGALLSCSRTAIVFSLVLLVAGGIYTVRHSRRLVDAGWRLKAAGVFFVVLLFGGLFLFYVEPQNQILREIRTVSWEHLGEGTFGSRWQQTTSAWYIWQEHPWFGVGSGGFHHYISLELDSSARARLHGGGLDVDNDALQFLVEHGVIGFGLMLGGVVVLLVPIVRRLRVAHLTNVEGWSGEPVLLYRISPIVVLLLTGTTLTFLQSLIDLPFRSPAILLVWSIALASTPAFLPSGKLSLPVATRGKTVHVHENPAHASNPEQAG